MIPSNLITTSVMYMYKIFSTYKLNNINTYLNILLYLVHKTKVYIYNIENRRIHIHH